MKFLIKIDNAILEVADRFILWLWNEFEIERRVVLRVVLWAWLLLFLCSDIFYHRPLDTFVVDAIFASLLAFLYLRAEIRESRSSVKALNAEKAALRTSPFAVVVRFFLTSVFSFICYSNIVMNPHKVAFNLTSFLLIWGVTMLDYTFTPEEPPKRRQVALLAPTKA